MSIHSLANARIQKLNRSSYGESVLVNNILVKHIPELSALLTRTAIGLLGSCQTLDEWICILVNKSKGDLKRFLMSEKGNIILSGIWYGWRDLVTKNSLDIALSSNVYNAYISCSTGILSENGAINTDSTILMTIVAGDASETILMKHILVIASNMDKAIDEIDPSYIKSNYPKRVCISDLADLSIIPTIMHPYLVNNIVNEFIKTSCIESVGFINHDDKVDNYHVLLSKNPYLDGVIYTMLQINKLVYTLVF